jgi:hypothetical protein
MVLYLCVLIVLSLHRESLKLILETNPFLRWFCHINTVLGNLMHLHYPGEVPWSGDASSTATCWANCGLSPNATYGNTQGAVWSDFWVSFLVIPFQSVIPDA